MIGRPPGSGTGPGESIPMPSLMSPGMIMPFAGSYEPPGWMNCARAQLLYRTDYAALFTVIGGLQHRRRDERRSSVCPICGACAAGVDAGAGRLIAAVGWCAGQLRAARRMVQYYCRRDGIARSRVRSSTGGGPQRTRAGVQSGGHGRRQWTVGGGGPLNTHSHGRHVGGIAHGTDSAWRVGCSGGGYTRNATNMPADHRAELPDQGVDHGRRTQTQRTDPGRDGSGTGAAARQEPAAACVLCRRYPRK